jgi:type I restriction enzyme S subunit
MLGYKQTEVGVIPEDWSVVDYVSFGQIIDGDRGIHYPSAGDLKDAGHCLFLNAGNVTKNGFRFADFNKGKLTRGDVVLTTRGTLGNFAYFDDEIPFEHIRINSGMVILRNTSPTVANAYQYLILQSRIVAAQIERLSFGSAQPQLTVKGISTLKISFPPTKAEQEAIAEVLSKADALIECLERLIAKKRLLKQGVMQELLTGRRRLLGFANSSTGYKQTEVGVIPEDWEVTNLCSVCSEPMQNGVFYKPSHKGVGVRLINVGDLYKGTPIDTDSLELFDANESERERFRVEDGDLFFTRSSVVPSGIAHCNIYKSNRNECVVFDSHIIRVRPDNSKVVPSYLFRFCVSSVAREYLVSHAKTATMTTIDQSVLSKCPVLLPTKAEQDAIAEALSAMDAEVALLEAQLAKYRQIKQGLMQNLLTGRIRLI